MQINFNKELQNFDGQPLREGDVVNLIEENGQINKVLLQGKALALKAVVIVALNGRYQEEQLTVEQHVDRYMLAKKIHNSNGEGLDLTTEEIVTIKGLLAKTNYLPIVVGQACQILEGHDI